MKFPFSRFAQLTQLADKNLGKNPITGKACQIWFSEKRDIFIIPISLFKILSQYKSTIVQSIQGAKKHWCFKLIQERLFKSVCYVHRQIHRKTRPLTVSGSWSWTGAGVAILLLVFPNWITLVSYVLKCTFSFLPPTYVGK